MPRVYVSIGSNVRREANIRAAVAGLGARYGELQLSSVYENPAEGFAGAHFYNLVAGFSCAEPPAVLCRNLRALEEACGRRRGGPRFADRTLDLDLLLYGEAVIDRDGLRIPREEITRYAFVLGPLAEIAGDLRHPVSGLSIAELWRRFPAQEKRLKRVPFVFHDAAPSTE